MSENDDVGKIIGFVSGIGIVIIGGMIIKNGLDCIMNPKISCFEDFLGHLFNGLEIY